MFGHEGDRHHEDGDVVGSGALDLFLGAGTDPALRSRPRLIAYRKIQARDRQAAHHPGDAALDLKLIRVTRPDDDLRQAVRREQDPQPDPLRHRRQRRIVGAVQHRRRRCEVFRVRMVAAQRRCRLGQPSLGRCLAPRGQAAAGRRRGIVRVKRQQHDPVWVPFAHRPRRLQAERMPVAHGDEAARARDRLLERPRLLLGQLEQRALAAEEGVVGARGLDAQVGDQPGEERTQEKRHPQDRRVAEQVDQERPGPIPACPALQD